MDDSRHIHRPDGLTIDPSLVRALIHGRRTVKPPLYTDQTIDREIIDDVLESANWAPTHGMTEPWRFEVYTGEARETLASRLENLYRSATSEHDYRPEKISKLQKNPRCASHIIAIKMQRTEGKIPEIEEVEAVACAVQNMSLTAFAYGLGSFWSTGPMIYHRAASQIFNLDEGEQLLGFLYLGYPRKEMPNGVRKSIQHKVTWADA